MPVSVAAAAAFCALTTALHLAGIAAGLWRCRRTPYVAAASDAPAVTIIRPVCGLDNHAEQTLRSAFTLDYPRYAVILCAADANDPIVALAQTLIADYPQRNAQLLIGEDRISANPKLNNVVKGWRAARTDWIVIADSNVLMPPDYLQRLLANWDSDTGLVCSPPVGSDPDGFAAELECAFLNGFQARWQYLADTLGFGFAQGKSMLWRRADLARGGGMAALAIEAAEDAAATKLVRGLGLRVRLVDAPFGQPLGRRPFGEVWKRQARWAQLRRASFPLCYGAEAATGGLLPLCALGYAVATVDGPAAISTAAFAFVWYGAEVVLAAVAGWHLSWRSPIAAVTRDAMLPALWICGWVGRSFVWRGNVMRVESATEAAFAAE